MRETTLEYGPARAQGGIAASVPATKTGSTALDAPKETPTVLISLVTKDSGQHIFPFFQCIENQSYPLRFICVSVTDIGSSDDTIPRLARAKEHLGKRIGRFEFEQHKDKTEGAGHNFNASKGDYDFVLVVSPHVSLDIEAIRATINLSQMSTPDVAAWELKQRPVESSKIYSPSTLETSWTTSSCTLFRMNALRDVGGFEERALDKGKDVELSYRLRDSGYRLLYCPQASFWCQDEEDIKEQRADLTPEARLSNLFIRMRYGSLPQKLTIPKLVFDLWRHSQTSKKAKAEFPLLMQRVITDTPKYLLGKRRSSRTFPICGWDLELMRSGKSRNLSPGALIGSPPVSIIICKSREDNGFLLECMRSIANQSYPNLEIIVVERAQDGKKEERLLLDRVFGPELPVKFSLCESESWPDLANQGLELATGEYLTVIGDDTLLFADHFERMIDALNKNKDASIAYSMHMEIETEETPSKNFSYYESRINRPDQQPFARARLWSEDCIPFSAVIFHRAAYELHGKLDTELASAAGWDLLTRFSLSENFEFVDRATLILRTPASKEERKSRLAEQEMHAEAAKLKQHEYKLNITPADILAMHRDLGR